MMGEEAMDMRDAALRYLARGWSVIPVLPGSKRPLVPWLMFQQRRPTPAQVHDWFRRWPDANVAVVTGTVSGLVVLDIDVQHGGAESLARLEQIHGALPSTLEAVTGGGGRHLYFAHPGGILHNRVGIEPGIDLRGDGGYVVAPPSLHPSGRRYRWAPTVDFDTAPAAMPGWLTRRLLQPFGRVGHPLAHWRQLVRAGVKEGERNNTIASLAGHLLWRGVDPAVTLDLLLCWNAVRCRPPLPEDEVTRTVESITRLHLRQEEEAAGGEGASES
ncbi:MAG TPA: bifunctional DNA primase/polymerase [Methylococcus sp.]|nr:bifunctional DNA primase/polymerase [Methylococcus sp.]